MKKTVLVTGSSRGIGRAIALKYAEHGYNVVINCARSTDRLEQVKKEAEALGAACLAVQADVGIWEDCVRLFAQIQEHFGDLDILVNNAGISWIGLLQDMDVSQWNTLIASNLSSVFHCCKLAVPGMIKKQSGRIVNISSVWGVCGASCEAAYSASKGGVGALTQALAKELAPSGIQLNAHCLRRHRYGNERVSVRRRGRSAPGRDPGRPHGAAGRGGRCGLCHDRIPGLPHRPGPPSGRRVDLIQRKTVPGTDRDLGTALQDSGSADSGLWIGLLADIDSGSGTGFWGRCGFRPEV